MDFWREIWETIKRNKMRTIFTGFSVAWGIFMLIILLAAGNGLKNGITLNWADNSVNRATLYDGRTSKEYGGYNRNREIKFNQEDIDMLLSFSDHISIVSPIISGNGGYARVGDVTVNCYPRGIIPDHIKLESFKIVSGRFINEVDIREERKAIVISQESEASLFKGQSGLGKIITFNKLNYTVVGIYKHPGGWQRDEVFIPFTTAQKVLSTSPYFYTIRFLLKDLLTKEECNAFLDKIKARLARLHMYDPTDESAIWMWSNLDDYLQAMSIFNGITLFIWIIGVGSLIAGIVGISNIMLITVKERTREIGIRKSMGATPASILRLVLTESLVITASFGYMGVFLGVFLTETINLLFFSQAVDTTKMTMFHNPTVDIPVILMASCVIVAGGVLAGFFPAQRAARVKPIEALRYE